MRLFRLLAMFLLFFTIFSGQNSYASGDNHGHDGDKKLDIGEMIMHHIADANEWHLLGDISIPLPCIVYHPEKGFDFFLSSVFHHGHNSYKGYVLDQGVLKYVNDASFPQESVEVSVLGHKVLPKEIVESFATGEEMAESYVLYNNKAYEADRTSFYDFSITKVVATMLLASLIMMLLFTYIAKSYKKNQRAPKGFQNLIEVLVTFVRDEIAKPGVGDKWEKYFPFLLTLFFFIWICNMLGLMSPIGSPNATGNLMVTGALALITFIIIVTSANKHYWSHIFNPPGVPGWVKIILVPIEVASMFIKPAALMIRLFANMTAGHIIILSLVGIIFLIANLGGDAAGWGTSILASAFMLFMNVLELFVAALQAYVFAILASVFIGQAVAEPHHH
ncbi:MAG: F0F1 ATP synthase subunit A [Chitinophagales bacterium]